MNLRLISLVVASICLGLSACQKSSGGGGGSPPPAAAPTVDAQGTWSIDELVTAASTDCAGEIGTLDTYGITVTQSGANLTVVTPAGTFSGTVSGDTIRWTGSFPEDGGTTTITQMTLTVQGDSLSGTSDWTWSDGVFFCTGSTQIGGTRTGTTTGHGDLALSLTFDNPASSEERLWILAYRAADPDAEPRVLARLEPGQRAILPVPPPDTFLDVAFENDLPF